MADELMEDWVIGLKGKLYDERLCGERELMENEPLKDEYVDDETNAVIADAKFEYRHKHCIDLQPSRCSFLPCESRVLLHTSQCWSRTEHKLHARGPGMSKKMELSSTWEGCLEQSALLWREREKCCKQDLTCIQYVDEDVYDEGRVKAGASYRPRVYKFGHEADAEL
nr:hypothetical protein CFP56_32275 [Quercus suber]